MNQYEYLADFDRPELMQAAIEEAIAGDERTWGALFSPYYVIALYARWLMWKHGLWNGADDRERMGRSARRANKNWLPEEDELVLASGNDLLLAEQLGRSIGSVFNRRYFLRHGKTPSGQQTARAVARMLEEAA